VAADLFPADDATAGPARHSCTPELLLAWVRELGRAPTLKECQDRYGGILSALVSGWELQRRGLWPGRGPGY
jgi:hypothetical protein